MRMKGVLCLAVLALTTAGCATGNWKAGDGFASPTPGIPDCRNQGSYNRAANLCVSGGP